MYTILGPKRQTPSALFLFCGFGSFRSCYVSYAFDSNAAILDLLLRSFVCLNGLVAFCFLSFSCNSAYVVYVCMCVWGEGDARLRVYDGNDKPFILREPDDPNRSEGGLHRAPRVAGCGVQK